MVLDESALLIQCVVDNDVLRPSDPEVFSTGEDWIHIVTLDVGPYQGAGHTTDGNFDAEFTYRFDKRDKPIYSGLTLRPSVLRVPPLTPVASPRVPDLNIPAAIPRHLIWDAIQLSVPAFGPTESPRLHTGPKRHW